MEKTINMPHADLASGNHVLRFEARKLDDIRKLGCNNAEDDKRFMAVARVSENLKGLYETMVSPYVRAATTEGNATFMRSMHPIRVRYRMFSDTNPMLTGVKKAAEVIRATRKPVSSNNIFWQIQEMISSQIVANLESYRVHRDNLMEKMFLEFYGAPFLQAAVGLGKSHSHNKNAARREVDRERDIQRRLHGLMELIAVGGLPEAVVRAMLYVVRGGNGFDEREFTMLRDLWQQSKVLPPMAQNDFKSLVRQQHSMLVLAEKMAMEAISKMLDMTTEEAVTEALNAIRAAIEAHGEATLEERRRLNQLKTYFTPSHTSLHRRVSDIQVFRENQ